MLTLKRKVQDRTFLDLPSGERITIIVTEARGGFAKLAIGAPADIVIVREEVEQRLAAARTAGSDGKPAA